MIFILDVKTNHMQQVKDQYKAEEYIEEHPRPMDLIVPNIIYCDGGGYNGTDSCLCVKTEEDEIVQRFEHDFTNNEMEYLALIEALKIAKDQDIVLSDSRLVVSQCTKDWKINKEFLQALNKVAQSIIHKKRITLYWIPREKNLAGKVIERKN